MKPECPARTSCLLALHRFGHYGSAANHDSPQVCDGFSPHASSLAILNDCAPELWVWYRSGRFPHPVHRTRPLVGNAKEGKGWGRKVWGARKCGSHRSIPPVVRGPGSEAPQLGLESWSLTVSLNAHPNGFLRIAWEKAA
jgi:hypothetical protein